ncbi:hypothetical protein RHMOL_Rhmol07G0152000 [Rhododendron molle]|uniref:Uncharacterized protein n=1 Tax=Rhododendron molle TaxID=49168 RepID=A0ACC0N1J4_RHOML|nr:hypothetical protein RHMOL_Rhmol07G0152000 [Rhododendron molle]
MHNTFTGGSLGTFPSQVSPVPGHKMSQVLAPTPVSWGFMPVTSARVQRPGMGPTQPSSPTQPAQVQPAITPASTPPTIQTVDTSNVPAQQRPVIMTLTRFLNETSEALGGSRANPAKKWEIEDNTRKIGALFAKLDISKNASEKLVQLCKSLDNGDFGTALQIQASKDNVVEIFLVISNSIVDDPLDVNVGNWEWDIGTFLYSGITIENVDMVDGLGVTLVEDEDDLDSDKNYDEFNDSDYEASDEDDRLYEDNVDDNLEWAGTVLSNTRVLSQTEGLRKIQGSIEGQYAKLWDYCNEVIDANDQTFPVAYAIVEQENARTWTWFLQHLITDIKIENEPGWTIISDKQKGLENAIRELLPSMEHRHCAGHLYNNFKNAGFPG